MSVSREQFVQQVIDVVRVKFPVAKVARAEQPFSLQVNGQIASLENLYRSSALHPDRAKEMIEQWMLELVRASEGPPDLNSSFEELSDRLLPMILREDQAAAGPAPMVYQPLVAGLIVGYAIDGPRSLWYVTKPTLARWNVELDALHELALENLVGRSEAIAAQAAQDQDGNVNLILFQTLDGLDASRILLPTLHERLREHLGSPFVAGVPNRDILLCFRDEPANVERLRQQIQTDFGQMPHPVTDRLLLVTPDGIAPHD
ncbi:MAG TPA: DUF1444 family protein [Tepidisphaeraceae bacterium]|nr:DUF1444 family protein [Tepidisphaeraceae bacterium]